MSWQWCAQRPPADYLKVTMPNKKTMIFSGQEDTMGLKIPAYQSWWTAQGMSYEALG